MLTTKKRIIALFVALVMCISCLPLASITASAADVSYTYDGKYIYNWGERGEVATFMSPNALEFYTGSRSYDTLSSYSGGSGKSDAPNSALYKNLASVMKNAHSYITSYNATKDLYRYTDCENGGGKISSFYSGKAIGPSWDGGWNREHTWPNSKGLGGSDENDIMMLRPTSVTENSSRGNTAYGQSSGYYNPNSESGGKYDLRGDVARIFLYVYVRWGNTGKAWGLSGVMESVDVLLKWMEEDPVDTWELGRNDSVQSITGTRNVFVDYPELAFLLFGEEIPEGMSTPSGNADSKCGHDNFDTGVVIAATCTAGGYTIYTCKTSGCSFSYKANFTDSKGHSYSEGTCTACGAEEAKEPQKPTYVSEPSVGVGYKLGMFSSDKNAEYYFTGSMSGYYGATDTAYEKGIDVYVESASGGYYLYFKDGSGNKQYINLVIDGTYYNFKFGASKGSVFTWDTDKCAFYTELSGERCYMGTYGTYVTVGVLRTSKMNDTDYIARLYTMGSATDTPDIPDIPDTPDTPEDGCNHNYRAVVTPPTCTNGGYTTYTCTLCADSYKDSETAAKGHSYDNGKCTSCGATEGASSKAEISFTSTSSRTEFSTTKQVWVQNGITVTNNKASSQTNVANFSNPARFYKGSEVIIASKGITKIEIDCTGVESKYVGGWLNVPAGATATNSGGIITITFDSPVDELTYSSLSAQSRAYGIAVYVEAQTPACQHTSTTVTGAIRPGCTAEGHTGITSCAACGEVLDEGEILAKTEHALGEWAEEIAPTCTSDGEEVRECANCDYSEQRQIQASGHSDEDEDDRCDACGEKLSEDGTTDTDLMLSDEAKAAITVAVVIGVIIVIVLVCSN